MLGDKLITNRGDCSKLPLLVCLPYPQCNWRKLHSAPKELSQMHAVLDREEKMMYVGGFEARHTVLCYNLATDSWNTLPRCSTYFFAIAYFMGKLIAVGGLTDQDNVTVVGTVYEFNEATKEWVKSVDIPAMPTPRSTPTVIVRHGPSSSPAIAACGGLKQDEDEKPFVTGEVYASTPHGRSSIATCKELDEVPTGKNRKPCDTVEVYSHDAKQWHKGVSLPHFRYWMSSVTIQNKCYLLGGYSYGRNYKECIFADLDSLMDTGDSACATTSIWKPIKAIPLMGATAARLGENLVAIGGQDDDNHTSTAVHILTGDGSWKKLPSAVLPEPCKQAAAINLSSGELIIIGGSFHPKEQNRSVKKADALIISASATREH